MPRTFVWHRTRGPHYTAPQQKPGKGRIRIKQVRSGIGHPQSLRLTLKSIGLRHHQDVVIRPDSAALRGQLNKVRHLVEVTPVKE